MAIVFNPFTGNFDFTGSSSGVTDGDKGDITVSNSGATWSIDNGVVETANLGGDITAAGKALLDDADAAAQRTTLGAAATDQTTYVGTTAIALNRSSADQALTGIQGITFPATQVPSADANTLDDYEEGIFTPYIIGMTVTGTGTYTFQNGFYTKIGNQVVFQLSLGWSAHTGSGAMRLDGLPFTTMSDSEQTCSMISNGMSSAANTVVRAIIDNNTTQIRFFDQLISTGTYTATNLDTSVATLFINGVYRI